MFVSMGIGFVLGVACALTGAPIPAPPTMGGLLGIVGVCCGYWVIVSLKK